MAGTLAPCEQGCLLAPMPGLSLCTQLICPSSPAILECHAPAQGFRGCCTLARSPRGCGMGGRMLPGPPVSPLKAKAAPGDGDSAPTGSKSSAQAPCTGGARETQGWCRQLPGGKSCLGLQSLEK